MKNIKPLVFAGFLFLIALFNAGATGAIACTRLPLPEALDALTSSNTVKVSTVKVDSWDKSTPAPADDNIYYVFKPKRSVPKTGFIVLPGGNCDPRSYAPAAHAIAAKGFLTFIIPMPSCVAIPGYARAGKIIQDNKHIKKWVIGGHSVGGLAASIYAIETKTISGVVIWACEANPDPAKTLANSTIKALSVYGSLDGRAPPADIKANAEYLPPDTVFVEIAGGNHTQFGYIDLSPDAYLSGDNPATITIEEQQKEIVDATVGFLRQFQPPRHCSVDRSKKGYELAGAYDNCTVYNAQKSMTHIECKDIEIRATRLPMLEFGGSYAALNAAQNWIQPFYTITAENMSAYPNAPASINGVILAKFKSKDSVDAAFNFHNPMPQGICEEVQEDIYHTVLYEVLTPAQRIKYQVDGKHLRFIRDDDPDRDFRPIDKIDNATNPVANGSLWLDVDPATKVFKSTDNKTYYYEPWSLYVKLDDTTITDEKLKGVRYCKLLSHQAILSWMLEKSFEENPVLITPTSTVCDGPSALESPTNGSCLFFSTVYNNNYFCADFTGSGFTQASSQTKCETNSAYDNQTYSTLPCSQRTAEIAAFIPGYQGLTGICVVHCKAANEFILNIYNDNPETRCGGFDFFTPGELWK